MGEAGGGDKPHSRQVVDEAQSTQEGFLGTTQSQGVCDEALISQGGGTNHTVASTGFDKVVEDLLICQTCLARALAQKVSQVVVVLRSPPHTHTVYKVVAVLPSEKDQEEGYVEKQGVGKDQDDGLGRGCEGEGA